MKNGIIYPVNFTTVIILNRLLTIVIGQIICYQALAAEVPRSFLRLGQSDLGVSYRSQTKKDSVALVSLKFTPQHDSWLFSGVHVTSAIGSVASAQDVNVSLGAKWAPQETFNVYIEGLFGINVATGRALAIGDLVEAELRKDPALSSVFTFNSSLGNFGVNYGFECGFSYYFNDWVGITFAKSFIWSSRWSKIDINKVDNQGVGSEEKDVWISYRLSRAPLMVGFVTSLF